MIRQAPNAAPPELTVVPAPYLELVGVPEQETAGSNNFLTATEHALITDTSLGKSSKQLVRRFGDRHSIRERYDTLQNRFGVPTVAAVFHQVIERGLIEVGHQEDSDLIETLSHTDLFAIRCIARGITEREIAPRLGRPEDQVYTFFNRAVTDLGARSRPHAVRQGHIYGILS
jgi:DNA-binding CsgD family transcriptional regulator